jgi:diguanylate cyclase (GGDEF)-like protein
MRILILEDAPADAELSQRELRRAGLRFEALRVETRAAFERALREFEPDLVLSDFSMPTAFDGLTALGLTREHSPELPFIFVSGTLGEDRAVEAMKRGATDYVLKDRPQRLPFAVASALKEARDRGASLRAGRKAQQRLDVQHAIARVLAEAPNFERVPSELLRVTCENMGFTIGVLWEVDESADALRCTHVWHAASPALEKFAAETRNAASRAGTGMARRAWKTRMPVWVPDATVNPASPRAAHAAEAGLHENLAFPITVQGRITGVVDFFGPEAHEPEPGLLEVFAAIGTQIGQFVERKNQQQKIARLNRIHAVLSGINSAIMRIRDRQELLEEACRIAVDHGRFGLVWVGLLDPETLDVTPVAAEGWGTDEMKRQLTSARADAPAGQGLVGNAIRERQPRFINDLPAEPATGWKRRQEALRLGYRSSIALPLYAEDAVAGVLVLYAKEADYFTDDEIKLLTELAGDISFALDYLGKQEKLDHLAYYDALTGLPNRSLLHERLTQKMDDARLDGSQVAVLFIDVKRFRLINETLGRHEGDALLRDLAGRFRQLWPDPDHIARIAGDCFAGIIVGAKDLSQIAYSVEKLLTMPLVRPFRAGNEELRLTTTGAIAVFPADGSDAEGLMQNAEAALRRAKAQGERYLFYRPEMNATVAEVLSLENKLRRALDKEQFVLHYQPKIGLAGRRVTGLEALIRWQDPEAGLVPPARFVPLLEETGMILEAGRWALHTVLKDRRAWQAEGVSAPRVAVNVSAIQLRRDEFVDVVREAIRGFPDGDHGLDLEITESLVMEDIEGNIRKLREIRDLGVSIAVDDFGTGYSSLRYLAKLPVNVLKIDRSFISTLDKEPDSMSIVSTIISLAHSLKLRVVAEGVDSREQLRLLELLKCDEIQGYIFSKPLPSPELVQLLRGQ